MIVAVVGSRDWPDPQPIRDFIASLPEGTTVVSGGARGVDSIAAFNARARGLKVLEIKADWDRGGRGAGFARNAEIVAKADKVVAFWDGRSRGTEHTISLARAQGKLWQVVNQEAR